MKCQRCKQEVMAHTMSYFNTDIICMHCDKKERAHPKYKEAKEAEFKACQAGNFNFKGVGKPANL